MTTKITIENDLTSNGDLHIVKACGFGTPIRTCLLPGEKFLDWVSTGHVLTIYETWPTSKPPEAVQEAADPSLAQEPDEAGASPGPAADPATA